ncbi:flocculation-associated PEP-CTERM protein PepA [Pelomonas sp. KK5]|uniref:flocculation-associated PEP-CTERM protein PepA n=1 Tax=Pelomonas sp. KK5 TaxID=1855730 RepID=UPI00097C6F6C|nr:flocculation-associated PEP-CTERM protein PepA [Pelomonas sp. KK5]
MNTTLLGRGALAAGLLAISAAASALPSFTFDPSAVGLSGDSFTADNLLISDYARVTTAGASFTESGFLSITAAQSGDDLLVPSGLNSASGYSLFISFVGSGTQTSGTSPLTGDTSGKFSSLTYTLYAVAGKATFSIVGGTPTTSATSGLITLASGSLIDGSVGTRVSGSSFSPSADATLSFNVNGGSAGFFADPSPFNYNQALTSFTNTSSQVTLLADGFAINKGGGAINFATAVPEPESYAMLMAGLVTIGFLRRRRGMNR